MSRASEIHQARSWTRDGVSSVAHRFTLRSRRERRTVTAAAVFGRGRRAHDTAATLTALVGAVIPEIPVAAAAAAATLVENAVALLSVTLALVALDAGMEIVASTLTLALAGDDVPVTPPTAKSALAIERSVFAAARVVDETSYVTDAARSRRRAFPDVRIALSLASRSRRPS